MKPYIKPNDDRDYTDTIKFQKKKQKLFYTNDNFRSRNKNGKNRE